VIETPQRSSVRTAHVWQVLRDELLRRSDAAGRPLDVLDVGGGTGGVAVPVARLGHRVTVVDPSPDALAALDRRAAEAGPAVADRVRGVQGDLTTLRAAVPDGVDVAVCHGVLEFADDPAEGCRCLAGATRPGGVVSVLAPNRNAVVLARALAGHLAEARHALADPDGRFAAYDPAPRRFRESELVALLGAAGLRVTAVHGIRVFTDLLPGQLVDGEPATLTELLALESDAAELPEFRAIAAQLHVLAVSGTDDAR
jgi:SAM-dependent methyltransferase